MIYNCAVVDYLQCTQYRICVGKVDFNTPQMLSLYLAIHMLAVQLSGQGLGIAVLCAMGLFLKAAKPSNSTYFIHVFSSLI